MGFPHAQAILRVVSEVEPKAKPQPGRIADDRDRYFISSMAPENLTKAQWRDLPRGHWGGVEIRCNWRADACLYEDRTRSRNYRILCNTMLLRHALMGLFVDHQEHYTTLPAFVQAIAGDSHFALRIIRQV